MSFTQLLTEPVWELLNTLPPYDPDTVFTLSTQLRREGHSPELISTLLTQSRLRAKATWKFGEFASGMLFTADGLEQATRLSVGAFHARRFSEAKIDHVIDFGCGLGADSMAFAALGMHVTAVEADPDTAAAATVNLRHFPEADVIMGNGFTVDLPEADAIWIDPARRADGHRIKDPEKWMPKLSEAIALARRYPAAGIKVSPGIDYRFLPEDALVEWTSVAGSLVEAVIWLGKPATPGRRALIIKDDTTEWDAGVTDPRVPSIEVTPDTLGPFLYEPDPALIRAGAIESLCAEFNLWPVAPGIAYLTGKEPIHSPMFQSFCILDVLPIEPKPVRKELLRLGIGSVEIKKRGTDLVPETFRKKLKLKQQLPGAATLIATPLLDGKHRILLAERI